MKFQYKVPYIGGIKNLIGRAMFYISIINFAMVAMTTYTVAIRDIVDIPMYAFLSVLFLIAVMCVVFEYTVMLPSELAFLNNQVYTAHRNPMRDDILQAKADIREIKNTLHED